MWEVAIGTVEALHTAQPRGFIHREIVACHLFVTERSHAGSLDFLGGQSRSKNLATKTATEVATGVNPVFALLSSQESCRQSEDHREND